MRCQNPSKPAEREKTPKFLWHLQVADHEAALKVFRQLKGAGLQPTAQCYTSLLTACSRGGDLRGARRVFRSMHVQPSVEAYTALMDACLKDASPAALDEAFEVAPLQLNSLCDLNADLGQSS